MRALMISFLALAAACSQQTNVPAEPATTAEPAAVEAPAAPTNQAEATAQDTCGAAAFASLVGTMASAIDQATLPAGTRVITPDMMVTQDFSAQRLNIMVGTDGKVGSLACY